MRCETRKGEPIPDDRPEEYRDLKFTAKGYDPSKIFNQLSNY